MDSYRDYIAREFEERSMANPSYSMRSFARDLSVSPSSLSEILNSKKGISVKKSESIAKRLKMPDWQAQLFCDLVTVEHGKSPTQRELARIRIEDKKQNNSLKILNDKAMRLLCSWVELAILELTYLDGFCLTADFIANKLGIDSQRSEKAIKNLKEAELLVEHPKGKWVDNSPLFSSSDNVPNMSIRNFHKSVLQKAVKKIDQNIEKRTVKTVVFSISQKNKIKAKKVLDEAIAKIVSLADQTEQKREDVLCFSTQLFTLIEDSKKSQESNHEKNQN